MKKKSKLNHRKSTIREAGSDLPFIVLAASAVSLLSFLYYFQRGEVLLYGDAIAHINIARRVFDSQTPGLLQLGTVWLPLPHLLMLPFLVSDWLWRTGVGGSIPSMVAYVFSVAVMLGPHTFMAAGAMPLLVESRRRPIPPHGISA